MGQSPPGPGAVHRAEIVSPLLIDVITGARKSPIAVDPSGNGAGTSISDLLKSATHRFAISSISGNSTASCSKSTINVYAVPDLQVMTPWLIENFPDIFSDAMKAGPVHRAAIDTKFTTDPDSFQNKQDYEIRSAQLQAPGV